MIFLNFKFIFLLCLYGSLFSMNPGSDDYRFRLSSIPQNYRDELSLNVYILCKASDQKKSTPEIMQLVKHVFKDTFPNDVIFKILNYSIKSCLISLNPQSVQNLEELKRKALLSVLKAPIVDFSMKAYISKNARQEMQLNGYSIKEIASIEPLNLHSFLNDLAIRITTTNSFVSDDNIEDLRKSGLIFFRDFPCFLNSNEFDNLFAFTNEKRKKFNQKTGTTTFCFSPSVRSPIQCFSYNFYKTFNAHAQYSLGFFNRPVHSYIPGQEHTKKSFLHVFDRVINQDIMQFSFDDHIENCFCSGKILFVELMKKVIRNTGSCIVIDPRSNHRIEIYDLVTKNKVNELPLALSKKINDNKPRFPLYELAYVDNQKIYLRILMSGAIVSMNYYHQIMKYSSDRFFINDLESSCY